MSNPTYGQGSEPKATGGQGATDPESYASDQPGAGAESYAGDQPVSAGAESYAGDQPVSVGAESYASDQPVSADAYTDVSTDAYTDVSADAYTDVSTDAYTDVSTDAYTDPSTNPYTDVGAQPTDVSYGTVDQPYTSSYDESTSSSSSTKDVAMGEAGAMKETAVGAGRNVASTARDEAANVVAAAGSQAKSLMGTVTDEVRSQGRTQQTRLAEAVHSVAQELGSMGAKSEQSGPVADLAQQASRRAGEIGHWLETKEPSEVLDDVRSFARRRPAVFLGLCALAGVVVGRLGRGAVAANTSVDSKEDSSSYGYGGSYSGTPARYATTAPDIGYSTGYDTGYSEAGSYGGDTATGPSIGGYAAGTMPETGGTYAADEGLQPPYGGQDDLNR